MSGTQLTMPFGVDIDLVEGIMANPDSCLVRRASDMRGYYADEEALEESIRNKDPVHYEVFGRDIPDEAGHLRVAISKIHPGLVGDECLMTKGHYHADVGTGEVYLGLNGEGYILLKTSGGECRAEEISAGRMVYVPPHWAHCSVDTGDSLLTFFCVWPGGAGHNYGDIEKEGFPQRVMKRGGETEIVRC